MTDDERKGTTLFCYAVALAARKLDDGNFRGLNSETFLVEVEGQIEEGIKEIPEVGDYPNASAHAKTLIAKVRSLLELHESDQTRFPQAGTGLVPSGGPGG